VAGIGGNARSQADVEDDQQSTKIEILTEMAMCDLCGFDDDDRES
jgi:hypothetical protein